MYHISIHALLAESDSTARQPKRPKHHFYPRSPCGERPPPSPPKARVLYFYPRSPCGERRNIYGINAHYRTFLSTLSLRRATRYRLRLSTAQIFLSTLSLRRATSPVVAVLSSTVYFYPRSPCGERPLMVMLLCHHISKFLSTLSLRRATRQPARL